MNRSTLRRLVGTGLTTAALSVSAVAFVAPAGAADTSTAANTAGGGRHHRLHLTNTQKQCLKDQGITRPIRPLTPEKITALKAAAKACDIKLPNRGAARHR